MGKSRSKGIDITVECLGYQTGTSARPRNVHTSHPHTPPSFRGFLALAKKEPTTAPPGHPLRHITPQLISPLPVPNLSSPPPASGMSPVPLALNTGLRPPHQGDDVASTVEADTNLGCKDMEETEYTAEEVAQGCPAMASGSHAIKVFEESPTVWNLIRTWLGLHRSMTTLWSSVRWLRLTRHGALLRCKAAKLGFLVTIYQLWKVNNVVALDEAYVSCLDVVAKIKTHVYKVFGLRAALALVQQWGFGKLAFSFGVECFVLSLGDLCLYDVLLALPLLDVGVHLVVIAPLFQDCIGSLSVPSHPSAFYCTLYGRRVRKKTATPHVAPNSPAVGDTNPGVSTQSSPPGEHLAETATHLAPSTTLNTASPKVRAQSTPAIEVASKAAQPPQGVELSSVNDIPAAQPTPQPPLPDSIPPRPTIDIRPGESSVVPVTSNELKPVKGSKGVDKPPSSSFVKGTSMPPRNNQVRFTSKAKYVKQMDGPYTDRRNEGRGGPSSLPK
ncbi:hypothetical protein K2173_019679 [Erythroxylum novogranatense]|uniref:Uncharacterized protein n=1 Tax=Erythroxylum novogranatense TaxID=1862640 RepID=A0AAV8SM32_9ROSI|nr:hypothetical protein K2173_019679 [Erythroxylum novogranatense]